MKKWQSLVVGALWALSVCGITLPITGLLVKMATALLGLAYSRAATLALWPCVVCVAALLWSYLA